MADFTFSTLKYERPDFTEVEQLFEKLVKQVQEAASYEGLKELLKKAERVQNKLMTACTIASIRHTLDTTDTYYEKEDEYINNTIPTVMPKFLAFDAAVMNSPFRDDIEKEYGKQYFAQKELNRKTFCEANIPLMQQEAKLTNEYQKIMATAAIEFEGQTLNLYGVQKYFEHEDREVRRAAVRAYSDFYHSNEKRLEEIWEELITIRNQMGKNLGYANFIPVGYMQQGRTDYGEKEVAAFREQVRTELVPLCEQLYAAQAKRIGVDTLMFYDEKRVFPDGNAVPAGDDDFYHSNEKRLEEIWEELITIRNQMGKNLGYANFIPVGYMQQGRTDYGEKEVAAFREQVRTELVPLCEQLYAAQAKRIGVDTLMFYDEKRVFPDGNAVPAGDDDFMVEEARKMYHKISPETGEFIDFMIEHELMDLKNKPGKAATGYMTFLPDYRAPFVFSNFNQTIFDMQVLTHELGHAFAGYMAMREQPITEYYSESTDIAEIHSMSMEQFSYPYAEAFFGKYADKFRFAHLQEAITFVPFGVAVDEFQHICYANPELTPKERTAEWKKLEEKYMPWRKYDADDFFDRGGFWYHKLHIYLYPFYYINYTLTTMGAMEFKKKNYENHETAWQDYLNLCKCGGSMSYLETLRYANLSNPFEPGSVARAMEVAKQELMNSPFMR